MYNKIIKFIIIAIFYIAIEAKTIKIDSLVIYNQGVVDLYNEDVETKINHIFTLTNKIYENSGLDVKIYPIKVYKYDIDNKTKSEKVLLQIKDNNYINNLRNKIGADNVMIYRPYASDGVCGIAFVINYKYYKKVSNIAYSHTSINCAESATSHEIGHNSGLEHSVKQKKMTSIDDYARGYGVTGHFSTIMAYSSFYKTDIKSYKYSSPKLSCKGYPCGIEVGEMNEADAVKALKNNLPLMANFRKRINIPDIKNTRKKIQDEITKYELIVSQNNEKLNELEKNYKNKYHFYIDLTNEYKVLHSNFYLNYTKFKKLVKDYYKLKDKFKKLHISYKNGEIEIRVLMNLLINLRRARKTIQDYLKILRPRYEALYNCYIKKLKASEDYQKTKRIFTLFENNKYSEDKLKLIKLRKEYKLLIKNNSF